MSDSAKLHSDLEGLVGAVLHDRYRVESLLGSGGMGAVFRARHTGLERDVAIKVLHPEIGRDASVSKRFEREATSASRLDHPNCVRVTDFGATEQGTKYLVMELLEGSELEARLGRPWAPDVMIETAKQMLYGLEHAHHFGIIHRDLKPENVFITTDFRGQEVVKLVDFGIAKLLDERGVEKLTRQGIVFGTPRYMSPEQAAGGKIDERSDLYAAGLIFYEMLAGRPPFETDEPAQLLRMQIMAPPPPLPDSVPASLAQIVEKLLEKSKMDRYASAREVIDALDAAAAAMALAPPSASASGSEAARPSGPRMATSPTQAIDEAGIQPARSGAAWQPAAPPSASVRSGATILSDQSGSSDHSGSSVQAGAAISAAHGAQTHAYASGGHFGVGELATGSYADLTGASAPESGREPSPAESSLAVSHAGMSAVTHAAPVDRPAPEQRRRTWLPLAIMAALLLVGLAVVGVVSSRGPDDDPSSDAPPQPSAADAEVSAKQAPADDEARAEQPAVEPAQAAPGPIRPPADERADEGRGEGQKDKPKPAPAPRPKADEADEADESAPVNNDEPADSDPEPSDATTVDEDPGEIDRRRKAAEEQAQREQEEAAAAEKKKQKKQDKKSKDKEKGGGGKNSAPR